MSDALRIGSVLLLVLGNALFVAAEYALVAGRRSKLEERAKEGSRTARTALRLMDEPVRFIGTVQVGITLFSILLGAVGEPLLSGYFRPPLSHGLAFALAFIILTYLSVSLGELVPKAITLQKAESVAMLLAIPIDIVSRLTKPLVWLLEKSANGVLRVFGIEPAPAGLIVHSREDVRRTVAEAEDVGAIQQAEEEMLYKVFDFADKEAHDVMVPRPEVVALSVDLPPAECLQAVMVSPYTRYPVYRSSLDEIVGILHVRDLFSAITNGGLEHADVEQIVRPAHIVPETKDLGALLAEFRKTNQHMAIVVDEYGAMQGIVTLEDLLEEIVGEIEDEFDLPDESVEQIDERTIRVHGTFPIDDFNERFGTGIPLEDYHSVGGFVFGRLGRAAQPGDNVSHDGVVFEVIVVEGSRIERLLVRFEEPTVDAEEEARLEARRE